MRTEETATVLAKDGIERELEYITENNVKIYEFKDHYGYDYIAGRVRAVSADYVNRRVSAYFSELKKQVRHQGYTTFRLSYQRYLTSELKDFFTLSVVRAGKHDKVVMNVKDMSEKHFREAAEKKMHEKLMVQDEKYEKYQAVAYAAG